MEKREAKPICHARFAAYEARCGESYCRVQGIPLVGACGCHVATAYAFTSEGIFLLKESDDGTFKDAGLISTHRLRDAGSVIVGGRSIEFVTDSGEVMHIEGTVVKSGGAESGIGVSGTGSGSGAVCLRASGEGDD